MELANFELKFATLVLGYRLIFPILMVHVEVLSSWKAEGQMI